MDLYGLQKGKLTLHRLNVAISKRGESLWEEGLRNNRGQMMLGGHALSPSQRFLGDARAQAFG